MCPLHIFTAFIENQWFPKVKVLFCLLVSCHVRNNQLTPFFVTKLGVWSEPCSEAGFHSTQTCSCAASFSSSSLIADWSRKKLQTVKYLSLFLRLVSCPCLRPFPGSFILLQTHGHFVSSTFKLKPLAKPSASALSLTVLQSKAVQFPFLTHPSHSVVPCLKICV